MVVGIICLLLGVIVWLGLFVLVSFCDLESSCATFLLIAIGAVLLCVGGLNLAFAF